MTARAEAHTARLAMIYCLLDGEAAIRPPHLLAALAVWSYVAESIRHVFGDRTGDDVADRIRDAVEEKGVIDREGLYQITGRNVRRERLDAALTTLTDAGLLVASKGESEGGRPATTYTRGAEAQVGPDLLAIAREAIPAAAEEDQTRVVDVVSGAVGGLPSFPSYIRTSSDPTPTPNPNDLRTYEGNEGSPFPAPEEGTMPGDAGSDRLSP
jgi:hypothetical protein